MLFDSGTSAASALSAVARAGTKSDSGTGFELEIHPLRLIEQEIGVDDEEEKADEVTFPKCGRSECGKRERASNLRAASLPGLAERERGGEENATAALCIFAADGGGEFGRGVECKYRCKYICWWVLGGVALGAPSWSRGVGGKDPNW
ncbi:hypothetical protein F511_18377 [Dorcoceras hygrometricum]|uniref:Uncharacterized protein n=1 Tax=Dorcoceras hygrometricum TaxID=472368 RepID=A0A2Z7C7S3_9LAMI|nr:hypothetical protein F511_18377 [Dorcoceras hygrometricum]